MGLRTKISTMRWFVRHVVYTTKDLLHFTALTWFTTRMPRTYLILEAQNRGASDEEIATLNQLLATLSDAEAITMAEDVVYRSSS